jgi:microcystin-dependent protein
MAYTAINIGIEANDGTGSPLRTAFDTVNDNFQIINDGLYAGTRQTIISALSVQGEYFLSNTYILANTYISADSLIGNSVTSNGNLFVSQGGAFIFGNVNIVGNLTVSGSQASSQSQQSTAPIIVIHANAAPYTFDDDLDIGLKWQYYDGTDKYGFIGRQNTTGTLVYLDDVTESANVITSGSFGNVQFGQLLLSNTAAATSNITGALQVTGGAGIQGNVYVQSNVFVGNNANVGNITVRGFHVGTLRFSGADTILINGSPVQTAAQAFNGGTVGLQTLFDDITNSTGLGTGAVRVAGGFSANGNVFVNNLHTIAGGNIRSNIIGNVITSNQPFITSIGTLNGLNVSGQTTTANIIPNSDNQRWLGNPGSRWQQAHIFNLTPAQISGAVSFNGVPNFGSNILATSGTDSVDKTTGAIVIADFGGLGVGGTVHAGGNIYIDNINDTSGLITSTSLAYVFNETATEIHIGQAGVTKFGNTTKATALSTGAVQITSGGMSITSGNLYVGGSAGNAVIATGNISATGNLVTLSNVFASGNIIGGVGVRGFLGNIYGSPTTGNTHVGSHFRPTANVTLNLGEFFLRYNTVYANVVNSYFVSAANVITSNVETQNLTTSSIVAAGGAFTGAVTAPTAPVGTNTTQVATTEFVFNNALPAGALMMWAAVSAPTGWLLCQGQAVSRSTYATLFGAIGTTFGGGDGLATFNLPDYRDRMPIGSGSLYATGSTGGSKDAVVVSHSHSVTDPGHVHQMTRVLTDFNADATFDAVSERVNSDDANYQNRNTDSAVTGISIQTAGVSGTNANMPPYLGIQFIIKT